MRRADIYQHRFGGAS